MRNYAEEFVYWYLRLNGFFPIKDFVLHHKGGDTDILAIRAPFTSEYVKGKRLKEDKLLIQKIDSAGCDFYKFFVCVIAEAKGGKSSISRSEVNKKFDLETLKYNLRRSGLFKESDIDSIAENLEAKKCFTVSNFATVHKILFSHERQFVPKSDDKFSFVSLEAVRNFIEKRMGLDFKIRDWEKFDSNMIQSIILQKFR